MGLRLFNVKFHLKKTLSKMQRQKSIASQNLQRSFHQSSR